LAKTKRELDKDMMFSKIMPSFAEHLQNQDDALNAAEHNLAQFKDSLFATKETKENADIAAIHNVMERLVLKYADDAVEKFNCCRCDRCRRDLVAYALNALPPKYVVANWRAVEEIEGEISRKEIFDALVKAAIKVRANPRH
jgi:hypothetical protein